MRALLHQQHRGNSNDDSRGVSTVNYGTHTFAYIHTLFVQHLLIVK